MAATEFYMDVGVGSNLNAGSTASGTPVYSSASGTFDATSIYTPTDGQTTTSLVNVGDWVSIFPTANTTTPFIAQVTAVGAGVNGAITVSTTVKFGTPPSPTGVACKARTGGCWLDFGMVAAGVALATGTTPVSMRNNIKAGTYSLASSRTFGLAGTTLLPIIWRGYKNTIGDQLENNLAVSSTDIPLLSGVGTVTVGAAYNKFENIDITSSSVIAATVSVTATLATFYGCRITATGANAGSAAFSCTSAGTVSALIRCYLKATTTASRVVFYNGSVYNMIRGCTVVSGILGIEQAAGAFPVAVMNCVFDSQVGDGIKLVTQGFILNCSFYNQGGHGIILNPIVTTGAMIGNNYFENLLGALKYAINNASGTNTANLCLFNNAYYNVTGTLNGITDNFTLQDNGVLASPGFNNGAGQDFTPLGVLQNIGNPSGFENVSAYRGAIDVGAVNHADAPANTSCSSP